MVSIPGREDPEQKQFRRPPPGMSQKPKQKGPYPSQPARKKRRRMTPQEEQQAMENGRNNMNSGYYGRTSGGGGSGKGGVSPGSEYANKGPYQSQPMPNSGGGNKGGMRAAISRRMSR